MYNIRAIPSTAMKKKSCQIESIRYIYSQGVVLLYGVSPGTENGTCNASMAAKNEFLWTLNFHFAAKQLQLILITKQDQEKVINPAVLIFFIKQKQVVEKKPYRK